MSTHDGGGTFEEDSVREAIEGPIVDVYFEAVRFHPTSPYARRAGRKAALTPCTTASPRSSARSGEARRSPCASDPPFP